MTRLLRAGVITAGSLLIALAAVGLWGSSSALVAAAPPPATLTDALAAGGIEFVADPNASAGFSPSAAEQAARSAAGVGIEGSVLVGRLTIDGMGAASIEDRLAFAVVYSGLEIPPMGKPGDPEPPDSMMHHELIVFVDAQDGAVLLSTTVR